VDVGVRSRKLALKLKGLRLFPVKALVSEMPILSCAAIDRLGKVELLNDDTGSKIKVLVDNLDEFS
jgi:hypothetical protein